MQVARWLALAALAGAAGCGGGETNGALDPAEGKPGAVAITVVGLPGSGAGDLVLTGPGNVRVTLTGTKTVAGLAEGVYTLTVADVAVDGDSYSGAPVTQKITVRPALETQASATYSIATGRIAVTVGGVGAGQADITVKGPDGVSRAVTGSGTLKGLPPGNYEILPAPVLVDGDRFASLVPSTLVLVTPGTAPSPVSVEYQLASGRIDLSIDNVPDGIVPTIAIDGPDGYSIAVTESQLLRGLAPGEYRVTGNDLDADGDGYEAVILPDVAVVSSGSVATPVTASYRIKTGSLALTVSGLPAEAEGAITVTGPGGYLRTVTATEILRGLVPGTYSIGAATVVAGGTWLPQPSGQTVVVTASKQPIVRTVTYSQGVGSLALTVTGVPSGAAAAIVVSGPSGYSQAMTGSGTLTGLVPGAYTIAATALSAGGFSYQPSPASQGVAIAVNAASSATVAYAATTGALAITVNGLGAGVNAALTVTGPAGFSETLTGTETLGGLVPGSYTITAAVVSSGGSTFTPTPASQSVAVTAGATASRSVSYAGTAASLTVNISGLPGGAAANVTVTGPGGFNQTMTATGTLTGLVAGSYSIFAANVYVGPTNYLGSPVSQTAVVSIGANTIKNVAYAATGTLSVTISGLPGGTAGDVTVTGPGGFSQTLTATTGLTSLVPGSYTIAATSVMSGGSPYNPAPSSQTVVVTGGATASATVTYTVGTGSSLNLAIDGMYLTQATAKYDGTTPVVASRDGYLRVFVKANQANTATPSVRVRIYQGATLVQTSTITAPGGSVPTAINEGTLASSWNLAVPGSLVQPNLRILADVDPTGAVAEADESDNAFPGSGTPFAVDVRVVPTWNVTLVPVLQQANGLQGGVTTGNANQYLSESLKLLPVAGYNVSVRAPYTTTAGVLQAGDANNAWGTVLLEILTLRSMDASQRYYYGVVKTTYGSGIAGMGYVGGGFLASIGWDHLPSASGVMAHEFGHNMARQHSPCGGAGGPDPAYPYAGGTIGVYGLDVTTLTVKPPTQFDFMGYCNPSWVSDYTWSKLITYRQSNPSYAPPAPMAATAGLLVWGRITSRGVMLEPALRVAPPTVRPTGSGAYRVDGFAADGRRLFSYPIDPQHTMVRGSQEHELHFSSVLPLDQDADQALARIRLVTPNGPVELSSRQPRLPDGSPRFLRDPRLTLAAPNAAQASFTWDAASYPMALVRDAVTGEILSFARGGAATLWTRSRRFDVTLTDGVRSLVRRVE